MKKTAAMTTAGMVKRELDGMRQMIEDAFGRVQHDIEAHAEIHAACARLDRLDERRAGLLLRLDVELDGVDYWSRPWWQRLVMRLRGLHATRVRL